LFQNDDKDIGVLILDIDDFKDYNDTYGHIEGDKCIMQVAKVVKDVSEEYSAISCRFGGEEFLVVLIDQDVSYLDIIAEKILQGVRDLRIFHDTQYGVVTISIGSATNKETNSKNYIELIHKADEAMYKAKGSGKNKYVKAISDN
ncbi:MAG: GGDEF domain-containing protein, partial [Clostridia bacterium]